MPSVAIVNGRASGLDDPERAAVRVTRALRSQGMAVEGVVTEDESELHDALERAAGGRAVLVGGDGSLHAAANAPVTLPELAVVPIGRANNVARQLGVPTGLDAAAHVAASAPAVPLDTLLVETPDGCRRCVEGLSAGLQAKAREGYGEDNSGATLHGLKALGSAFAGYRPYEVELELDGQTAYRGLAGQVFISNLALFGFGFEVNPAADGTDGRLEAIVLQAETRRAALLMLMRAYRGRHLRTRDAGWRRAATAALPLPLPLACDGVPLGTTTAAVSVEPALLRVAAARAP